MSEVATKNDLITFAGPIFDIVLRVKAGIVVPASDLRLKVESMFDDYERRAERYRFNHKIVSVAKFGMAAFVDEAVLTANSPIRNDWERNPLQLKYFGEQLAGNKFFDKLESMLPQIEVTQDAVEIYYYCMLLGFKGRYAVYEQEKLLATMQNTANQLVKVGKIKPVDLSPNWVANDQPTPPEKKGMPIWAKVGALGGLGFAFIVYLVMFLLSSKFLQETVEKLRV
jgi:type VI secretion system protein ImpK